MSFVVEYIPEADKIKHHMTPDSCFYFTSTSAWAVDRERDMFLLRRTGPRPEGIPGMIDWAFYWRGHLLSVTLLTIDSGGW